MNSFPPQELYYITVRDQLQSILEKGILSHAIVALMESKGMLEYTSIADEGVVSRRKNVSTPAGMGLWNYANLYFQPRNPMMFVAVRHGRDDIGAEDIGVVGVANKVLHERGVLIVDGNAAKSSTQFYGLSEGLPVIKEQWDIIQSDRWREFDDSKRKIMAECLVPILVRPDLICPTQFYSFATGLEMLKHQWHIIQRESWNEGIGTKRKMMAECLVPVQVKPDLLRSLYVANVWARNQVMRIIGKHRIPVIIERHMFFEYDIINDGR